MKAKVLMYAKNGNDVIKKAVELEKYGEHIYLQNAGDNCCNVIGEINNIFFYIMRTCNIERLNVNTWNHYVENFVDVIMNNENIFISNIDLQVFKELCRIDCLPHLLHKRNQWIEAARKEDERRDAELLALQAEQERKEKERFEEKYKEALEDYKETNVKPEMFLEMLLRNGIYVHPRTKFAIANNLQAVSARGVWNKQGKRGDTQKVFDAISELNEKLNIK